MNNQIIDNQNNPRKLEKLYRSDKSAFRRAFNELYPALQENPMAAYWNERLNYTGDDISFGTRNELAFVLVASLIAGVIAKLPEFFNLDEESFYPRNIGFIVFPMLTAYFAWKNKIPTTKVVTAITAMLAGLIYINLLPDVENRDSVILACIHLPFFLWSVMGFIFAGGIEDRGRRLGFLKYNGDLVVMSALLLIAGGILTAITIGLFSLIGVYIENFYFQYVAVFGAAAVPIVATYLTQTNPQLVGKVSPVIAKMFSPLVVVMLIIYLLAIAFSGKDPYNDRDFLMLFNALLIGVMAIIFFSVAETSNKAKSKTEILILLTLSIVTIIVNAIALSAILFRISEWGMTPNRIAVLGANILILINLLLVSGQLYKSFKNRDRLVNVGRSIADYLPAYALWTMIVTFLFPLLFGFE